MPAFNELPIINVVHPAYHCLPNGGHGSFFPSANLWLSWDRVFATGVKLDRKFVTDASKARTFCRVCDGCITGLASKHYSSLSETYRFPQLQQLHLL
jgi:hypothetical protein